MVFDILSLSKSVDRFNHYELGLTHIKDIFCARFYFEIFLYILWNWRSMEN